MTLAVLACLSLSKSTFDTEQLRELSTNNRASVPRQYHAMICDAATGKVYIVAEANGMQINSKGSKFIEVTHPEPSKVVYFEYLGRNAPYPHIARQIEDQGLSREERQRVFKAYHALRHFEEREDTHQTPLPSTRCARELSDSVVGRPRWSVPARDRTITAPTRHALA